MPLLAIHTYLPWWSICSKCLPIFKLDCFLLTEFFKFFIYSGYIFNQIHDLWILSPASSFAQECLLKSRCFESWWSPICQCVLLCVMLLLYLRSPCLIQHHNSFSRFSSKSSEVWLHSLGYCHSVMSWNRKTFIFKVLLVLLGPLHFHRNFSIRLSSTTKKAPAEILVRRALNPPSNMGSIHSHVSHIDPPDPREVHNSMSAGFPRFLSAMLVVFSV